MKFDLTTTQSLFTKKLSKFGGIWVVGGACRDLFLNRKPADLDFATNLLPDKVIEIVETLNIVRIPDATAYHHGIIRVVDKQSGQIIDIATTRSDTRCDGRYCTPVFTNSIEEDLARRDFTVNAIAAKIDEYGNIIDLIDPFKGQYDLNRKIVRFVGDCEARIIEDYLRIVRWCRMQALHPDMKYISYQQYIVKNNRFGVEEISKERIRDEIIKSLSYPSPVNFWRSMQSCGLFDVIFPELTTTINCSQNAHHAFESVWSHSLRTFKVICELTDNPMLRLAALLHDIGKPPTKSTDKNGDVHFYKHEVKSAEITYQWMKKYRFSIEQCEYVSKIIRNHQWRFSLQEKKYQKCKKCGWKSK